MQQPNDGSPNRIGCRTSRIVTAHRVDAEYRFQTTAEMLSWTCRIRRYGIHLEKGEGAALLSKGSRSWSTAWSRSDSPTCLASKCATADERRRAKIRTKPRDPSDRRSLFRRSSARPRRAARSSCSPFRRHLGSDDSLRTTQRHPAKLTVSAMKSAASTKGSAVVYSELENLNFTGIG